MAKVVYGPDVFHDAGNCREIIFGRGWSKPPIIFIICDICRGLMRTGVMEELAAEVAGALMKVRGPAAAATSAMVSARCFFDWAVGLPALAPGIPRTPQKFTSALRVLKQGSGATVPEAGFRIALDCPPTESTSSAGMEWWVTGMVIAVVWGFS